MLSEGPRPFSAKLSSSFHFILRALLVLGGGLFAGEAVQAQEFFVTPGPDLIGDIGFQEKSGYRTEFDFETGGIIDTLTTSDGVTVDVGLGGINGPLSSAETYDLGFNTCGVINQFTLLNSLAGVKTSQIIFDFTIPVRAFGTFIFDDTDAPDAGFRLHVTDADGVVTTSPVLNTISVGIEGFLGVTHDAGILSVAVEAVDGTLAPVATYFELDHVQVGEQSGPTTGYQWDDDVPNYFYLAFQAETGGMARFHTAGAADEITHIEVVLFQYQGPFGIGSTIKLAVWDDPDDDGDPTNAVLVSPPTLATVSALYPDAGTYALDSPVPVVGEYWVGVLMETVPNSDPSPLFDGDCTLSDGRMYYIGSNAVGGFNFEDLTANPPTEYDTNGVWMLRARGTGGGDCTVFTPSQTTSVGTDPMDLARGDLDRDGVSDVVTANSGGDLSVLYGDGAGGFVAGPLLPAAGSPRTVALGDVDGDGWQDVIAVLADVANCAGSALQVFSNDGLGGFTPGTPVAVGPFPVDVAVADLNRDGALDVVLANGNANDGTCSDESLTVLFGDGLGAFAAQPLALGIRPAAVAVEDLGDDGNPDVFVVDADGQLTVLVGDGIGGLTPQAPILLGTDPRDLVLTDFDRDGLLDVAVALAGTDEVAVLTGDGLGAFAPFALVAVGSEPVSLAALDLNLDGRRDLVVAIRGAGGVAFLRNSAVSGFEACPTTSLGIVPESLVVADVDGDGDRDPVATGDAVGSVVVLKNIVASPFAYEEFVLPAGDASFPDVVLLQDPLANGGPAPSAPFDDALAALGRPDAAGVVGPRTTSLGSGGVLELGFTGDRFANSGSLGVDLVVFEVGLPEENLSLSVRAASEGTRNRLEALGETVDIDGWVSVGPLAPNARGIDLDAAFPGQTAETLRFDAIRLGDDPAADSVAGPDVGADIDAVGVVRLVATSPDLAVVDFVTPAEGLVGQPYSVDWSIRNVGDGVANLPWSDRLWISSSPTFDAGNATVLGTFASPSSIGPGAGYSRAQAFTLPTAPGTYYFYIQTDVFGEVDESVFESDNLVSGAQPLVVDDVVKPDLVPELVGYPTLNVTSGSLATVEFRVSNFGIADTNAPAWLDQVWLTPTDDPFSLDQGYLLGTFENLTFLPVGGFYDHVVDVTLPSDISGDFYFAILSDAKGEVLELDETNNVVFTAAKVTVDLEDQPDLIPIGIGAPFTTGFSGQSFTVQWRDLNQGLGVTDGPSWVDAVYLSTNNDPSTLVGDIFIGQTVTNELLFGGQTSSLLTLDAILSPSLEGTFWIKVHTDASDGISEFGAGLEDNNVAVGAEQVTVILSPSPDLHPTTFFLPDGDTVGVGRPARISWAVEDIGFADWDFDFSWTDQLYISTDPVLDGSDVLVAGFFQHATFDEGTLEWVGVNYSKLRTILIPRTVTPGTYHLLLAIDDPDQVFEVDTSGTGTQGELNNVLASPPITVELFPANLVLTPNGPPTIGTAGQNLNHSFTVSNIGTADTPGTAWTDRVYLSADGILDDQDPLVVTVQRSAALAAGASYLVNATGKVPFVSAGDYQWIFVTDVEDVVFEPGGEGDNLAFAPFTVSTDAADLTVSDVVIPDTVRAGEALAVSFTVTNIGTLQTNKSYWTDRVYLSADAFLDGGDVPLGALNETSTLDPGSSRQVSGNFEVPLELSGLFHVLVQADAFDAIFEADETNNVDTGQVQIDVTDGALADLEVSGVIAAVDVQSGQPLQVSYTVENVGLGTTNTGTWSDSIYLSLDEFLDPATDIYLGSTAQSGFLGASEFREVAALVTIPLGLTGQYFVTVRTNSNLNVFEGGQHANNDDNQAFLTTITLPDPGDLRITDVTVSPTGEIGGPVSISWTVQNDGANPVAGTWVDAFHFTIDGVLDGSDTLIGQFPNTGADLPVGGTRTQSIIATVPGLLPGAYRVLGRTDVKNQILETDDTNNEFVTASTTLLTAIPIAAGQQVTKDLPNAGSLFFELTAPPNETLLVTLEHEELNAWTELYGRDGSIPTPGLFDQGFEEPGSNQQSFIIPDTTGDPYFLLTRATANVGPTLQAATLSAEVLPFGLTGVAPARAGVGIVTFELDGSQLDELAEVRLVHAGDAGEVTAFEVQALGAAEALAAFDLATMPFGLYDVVVTAGGGEVSTLAGAVTVEPATPLGLLLNLEISPNIRNGRTGDLFVTLRNAGNVNVPRSLVALGTAVNEGAATEDEEVLLTSPDLVPEGFESGHLGQSLVLFVEDLGPSQEVRVPFDVAVGDFFDPDLIPLTFSAVPRDEPDYVNEFVLAVAEDLRLAVLADQTGGNELLALASSFNDWLDAVLAGWSQDGSFLLLPGTPAVTGRGVVEVIGLAATSGLPDGNDVPAGAVDLAAPSVACLVFANEDFDCFALAPLTCGLGSSTGSIVTFETAAPPVGELCAASPVSDDPNEKKGPKGVGEFGQNSSEGDICFRVYFENVPEAEAPAGTVTIVDELDPTFDVSSFRVGPFQLGPILITPPRSRISYQAQVDMTEERGVLVNVTAGVNAATREAFWIFESVDPVTGEPPLGADVGFLPPNNEDGDGEGFVEFLVRADSSMNTFTVTTGKNKATITFDNNPFLTTNTVEVPLDTEDPTSEMNAGFSFMPGVDISLDWSGADPEGGSGLRGFSIYVSEDGGAFFPILLETKETETLYRGQFGTTYAFYSLAVDNTGRTEAPPTVPDAIVNTPPDCNGNGIGDDQDISSGTSNDLNGNGVPDECEDCDGNGLPDDLDIENGAPDCNLNGILDSCDIASGTSGDCDSDGVPDECEPDCNGNGVPDDCDIASGTSNDCNGNSIPDECDIADGTSQDCNSNGIPDECEPDCNGNGVPDDCDIASGTSNDCNGNSIPDECDIADGTSQDCNSNGIPDECEPDCNGNGVPDDCDIASGTSNDCNGNSIPDECDIADGTSQDCNSNGIPDECEPDCNGNGVPDDCDIASGTSNDCNGNSIPDECDIADGTSQDCNSNGIPDECEPDCNGNGVPDDCDIASGTSNDCNGNSIPDECDIADGTSQDCNSNGIPDECEPDCNGNGVPDDCDIASGTSNDCNGNSIPDECDIADGTSQDCNSNGIPDECEPDCNGNGIPDDCDIASGTSSDCNGNLIPDECDIADGTSQDADGDGIPDECGGSCGTVEPYCDALPNSTGLPGVMGYQGSLDILVNDLTMTLSQAPPGEYAYLLYARKQGHLAFAGTVLCLRGIIRPIPKLVLTDDAGAAAVLLDFTTWPLGHGWGRVDPGSTWNFQFIFSDKAGSPLRFNYSNALHVTFCQ